MILDEEVFAVLLAIVVIGSVLGAVLYLRSGFTGESFVALGLLNEKCKIGDYPSKVFENTNVTFCIYVYNHMNKPVYYRVVYKIGSNTTLPTNTTPSPNEVVMSWRGVLGNDENHTFTVNIPVYIPRNLSEDRLAMIFELWIYDTDRGEWRYTGIWNHHYVQVIKG